MFTPVCSTSPPPPRFSVGAFDGKVSVFNLESGELVQSFNQHNAVMSADADWDGGLVRQSLGTWPCTWPCGIWEGFGAEEGWGRGRGGEKETSVALTVHQDPVPYSVVMLEVLNGRGPCASTVLLHGQAVGSCFFVRRCMWQCVLCVKAQCSKRHAIFALSINRVVSVARLHPHPYCPHHLHTLPLSQVAPSTLLHARVAATV